MLSSSHPRCVPLCHPRLAAPTFDACRSLLCLLCTGNAAARSLVEQRRLVGWEAGAGWGKRLLEGG